MAQTPNNVNGDPLNREYVPTDGIRDESEVIIIAGDEQPLSSAGTASLPTYGTTRPMDVGVSGENLSADSADDGDWQTSDDPNEIRQDIGDTRQQMGDTIDDIQQRLDPSRLMDQAKDNLHDATIGKAEEVVNNVQATAKNAGGTLLDTIKENPVPAALVGIGLGWLIMKTRENAQRQGPDMNWRGRPGDQRWNGYGYAPYSGQGNYAYGGYRTDNRSGNGVGGAVQNVQGRASDAVNTLQDKAGQMQDRASDAMDTLQDKAGQVSDQVQNTAQQVGQQAQMQAQRAQGWFEDTMDSNPLALGAIAAAVGVVAGLLIPETSPENRLMGPTRDRLVTEVANKAEDAIDRAQDETRNAAQAVSSSPDTGSTTSDAAQAVSQGSDTVVRKAKDTIENAKDNMTGSSRSSDTLSSNPSTR